MLNKRRDTSSINSGAMADIAFLLLIFFMVATTFHKEKSISMKLPPPYDGPVAKIAEDQVVSILINASSQLMIEEEYVEGDMDKILINHLTEITSKKKKPIINIKMHPNSDYKAYITILSEIKSSIRSFRYQTALKLYGVDLKLLNKNQYRTMNKLYPIRITETQIDIL